MPGRGLTSASTGSARSGGCMNNPVGSALRNAADILGTWANVRKTIVLIGPGQVSTGLPPEQLVSDAYSVSSIFLALQRANANVYQFDPNGLQTVSQVHSDFGMFAENTGGRAITNTNAPAELVPQMFRENDSYYLLGIPASADRNGRFHRLSVQVNRPGVQVRSRAGYYAAPARPPSRVRAMSSVKRALSGGLPSGDLPVALTVTPFGNSGKKSATVVTVGLESRR